MWVSMERAYVAALQKGGSTQPCTVFEKAGLLASPRRLAVALLSHVTGASAAGGVVTVAGRDQFGSTMSGQGTIDTPLWIGHPTGCPVPAGRGFKVEPPESSPERRFSVIDSITAPAGVMVALIALPSDQSLHHVGCVTSRDISMGRDARIAPTAGNREIVRFLPGGEMSIAGSAPGSVGSGIGMFLGGSCAAVIRAEKEGVNSENILVVDWSPSVRMSAPEGAGMVSQQYDGPFAFAVHLLAPDI